MNPNPKSTRQVTVDTELLAYLSDTSSVCNRLSAFNDLVTNATSEPCVITKRGINIHLQPGQLEASILTLSNRWKWHRKTITTFLDELEKRGYLRRVSNKVSTIVEMTCLSRCATAAAPSYTTAPPVQCTSQPPVQCPTDFLQLPSVAHQDPPLQLTTQVRQACRQVYDLFSQTFPLLDKPATYDANIEKDIYYVFFLGMRGDLNRLKQYFDIINADPFKNGTIADSSGTSPYKQSFSQLFSTNWQVTFDCHAEYHQAL